MNFIVVSIMKLMGKLMPHLSKLFFLYFLLFLEVRNTTVSRYRGKEKLSRYLHSWNKRTERYQYENLTSHLLNLLAAAFYRVLLWKIIYVATNK